MFRTIRIFDRFAKNYLQRAFAHRLGGLAWVINGSIGPLLTMMVWKIAGESGSFAMNSTEIVTYFLISIIVNRVTQSWAMEELGERIKDGSISMSFIRPYHYILELVGKDLGQKVSRLVNLIPIMVILVIVFGKNLLMPSELSLALMLPALVLGYLLLLFISCSLGSLTYWVDDLDGLERMWWLLSSMASGVVIPLMMMPQSIRNFIELLPFRYFLSFPIEIALGQLSRDEIMWGYCFQVLWLVSVIIIYQILDSRLAKRYAAYGG